MTNHGIGQVLIADQQFLGLRGQHRDFVSQVLVVAGQGIDGHFMPAHLRHAVSVYKQIRIVFFHPYGARLVKKSQPPRERCLLDK